MESREAIEVLRDLLDTTREYPNLDGMTLFGDAIDMAISALEKQEKAENEWCPDCKEYDKENHCCHRFTKVIRQTVEECKREWANEGWIPVTERLPEEDCECRVTSKNNFGKSVFDCYWNEGTKHFESWDYFLDDYVSLSGVTAWKPIEEPYTEEEV